MIGSELPSPAAEQSPWSAGPCEINTEFRPSPKAAEFNDSNLTSAGLLSFALGDSSIVSGILPRFADVPSVSKGGKFTKEAEVTASTCPPARASVFHTPPRVSSQAPVLIRHTLTVWSREAVKRKTESAESTAELTQ